MTENEAKILLISIKEDNNWGGSIPEVFSIAIKALSEIQQYRAIGTVEEFKALKEKEREVLLKDGQLLYQQGLVDGYTKAITEFPERLNKRLHCAFSDDLEIQKYVNKTAQEMRGEVNG